MRVRQILMLGFKELRLLYRRRTQEFENPDLGGENLPARP